MPAPLQIGPVTGPAHTGIRAESQVIPGENPAELNALVAEYYHRFRPSTPERRFLVDTLINSDWLLRRYRKVEAQLWQLQMERADPPDQRYPLADAFTNARSAFARLQRFINSAERNYRTALAALQSYEASPDEPVTPSAPQPLELASFRHTARGSQEPAPAYETSGELPAPVRRIDQS